MFSDVDLPGRSPLFERLRSHGLRTDFRNSRGQASDADASGTEPRRTAKQSVDVAGDLENLRSSRD